MISVFRPIFGPPPISPYAYDGSTRHTPVLPVNHTSEDLTRDVYVKPLHSHNDYWRRLPLFDALSVGCQSIESDVWHFPQGYTAERTVTETTGRTRVQAKHFKNSEVFVGHNQVYLEPINTLFNLYLNPIWQYLEYANPVYTNSDKTRQKGDPVKHGIFYNSPETPLYLWMDFKTDPKATYEAIKPLLQRFIDKNYLAYYDVETDEFVDGPVVLTITGNLPVAEIEAETKRYAFLDGALSKFTAGTSAEELQRISKLSRVASASLHDLLGDKEYLLSQTNPFTESQKQTLSSYFDLAHRYGLKTRIWGDITWPMDLVKAHLYDMFELKSDFLNVDDVKAAADYF